MKIIFPKNLLLLALLIAGQAHTSLADPQKARSFATQAAQKVKMGDYAKAEFLYMNAMQEEPDSVEVIIPVAELYILQHRHEEADKILAGADQNNFLVWRTKSLLFQSQGNEAQSMVALDKAFALGGQQDRYVLNRLQQHYEKSGNKARQQQMENLLKAVVLEQKK